MKDTVQLFKALSDETRLRILALLLYGELCVCDVMEVLGLPQSTASRHLAYLKNAGWVEDRRQNKWMYYRIDVEINTVGGNLLAVLKKYLCQLDQVKTDQEKLKKYLSKKKRTTCH